MEVLLASASPRRRELLGRICATFSVVPSGIDETMPPGSPDEAARALALAKARAIAADHPAAVVVGADTIVVLDGVVFGKPAGPGDAAATLRRLRGRTHEVITGVAVARGERAAVASVRTRVTMREYSDAEIETYIATGEPLDKAGAYAVQERGAALVARVDGCLTNVVGLPVGTTRQLLADFGVPVRSEP
ncbi:MAG TPA: Maf family protein [Solirubrobacteraceae bacterium]